MGDRTRRVAQARGRRGKPATLVELAVVGQVVLDAHTEQLARAATGGAVVDARVVRARHAHREEHGHGAGLIEQPGERVLARAQEGAVVEEVGAGVPGEAEFGKHEDAHPLVRRAAHAREDRLGIALHVAHANLGRRGGDAEEPVAGTRVHRAIACKLQLVHANLPTCPSVHTRLIVPARRDEGVSRAAWDLWPSRPSPRAPARPATARRPWYTRPARSARRKTRR